MDRRVRRFASTRCAWEQNRAPPRLRVSDAPQGRLLTPAFPRPQKEDQSSERQANARRRAQAAKAALEPVPTFRSAARSDLEQAARVHKGRLARVPLRLAAPFDDVVRAGGSSAPSLSDGKLGPGDGGHEEHVGGG